MYVYMYIHMYTSIYHYILLQSYTKKLAISIILTIAVCMHLLKLFCFMFLCILIITRIHTICGLFPIYVNRNRN